MTTEGVCRSAGRHSEQYTATDGTPSFIYSAVTDVSVALESNNCWRYTFSKVKVKPSSQSAAHSHLEKHQEEKLQAASKKKRPNRRSSTSAELSDCYRDPFSRRTSCQTCRSQQRPGRTESGHEIFMLHTRGRLLVGAAPSLRYWTLLRDQLMPTSREYG
ncbi:Hypothetical predicted protein [Scomber scombrus]|uniref:Uncharacterized protein n=1 Tax=Scomber scombrus TaxID=13677 RepID=A0AAV1PTP1_SCOSC